MRARIRGYACPKFTAIALSALSLLIAAHANALPVVDGFASAGEYTEMAAVNWYNNHNTAGTAFPAGGSQQTAVYYNFDMGMSQLYLYLEAPIAAKNMIWGSGVTAAEKFLYYQHWCTPNDGQPAALDGSNCDHHDKGFDKFKTDYKTMTGSEKTIFAGIEANLAGDINKNGGYNILQYKDSVDYVIGNLGCGTVNCDASSTPMAFEFLFGGFGDEAAVNGFLGKIEQSGIVFHLSPERGGPESDSNVFFVPEPGTLLLLVSVLLTSGFGMRHRQSSFTSRLKS